MNKIPVVSNILFTGKQCIAWNRVEMYLKGYIGSTYIVKKYQDKVAIAGDFPDEYTESTYTKSLRGALAKTKANISQIIPELIISATNRRWIENKDKKHNKDASKGWYRYDTVFGVEVCGNKEEIRRLNMYRATLIVRITETGMFLYDVINIKKEASKPLESK